MLRHALKEWAVICRALAEGRQTILLRKGGISESGGAFAVEHMRFWLLPTYLHQQRSGIKEHALPLLQQAEAEKPADGVLRLDLFAEVEGVYVLHDVASVLKLSEFHLWSDETAITRYQYRHPGLHVLTVRAFRIPQPIEIADTPTYAGCRSWVELEREFSTDGAVPCLDDRSVADVRGKIDRVLEPTAFA